MGFVKVWMVMLAAFPSASPLAQAQERFPSSPVRVVAPFAPGNSIDFNLRVISEKLQQGAGQRLVIVNRRGGLAGTFMETTWQ